MSGRTSALLSAAVAAGVAVTVAASAAPRAGACCPRPDSVAALGGGASAAPDSWSTSTNPAVLSHYLRYRHLPGSSRVTSYTFATRGFSVADLAAQARQAVERAPNRYTTIELGVRDLCAGTPLKTFAARLDQGLRVLSKLRENSFNIGPILLVSIEDLAREWRVLRADPITARALRSGHHLACGLGYSVSRARLARIRARTIALNEILAEVCFRNHLCLYDRGTRFRMRLRAGYFSPTDPRSLSVAGQRALAAAEWKPAFTVITASG